MAAPMTTKPETNTDETLWGTKEDEMRLLMQDEEELTPPSDDPLSSGRVIYDGPMGRIASSGFWKEDKEGLGIASTPCRSGRWKSSRPPRRTALNRSTCACASPASTAGLGKSNCRWVNWAASAAKTTPWCAPVGSPHQQAGGSG